MKILLVDDDKNFLLSLSEGLKSRDKDIETIIAENGKAAVKQLMSHDIDLVISDLKMPEMDGIQVLIYISNHYSKIPVIVITAFSTPDIENELNSMGMFQLLEKPIDFSVLIQSINRAIEAKSDFRVNHCSLASFIQLIEIQKETCTLSIKHQKKVGALYFKEGILMDAVTGKKSGEKGFFEILSWESPKIQVKNKCQKKKRMIETPPETLLSEVKQKKTDSKASQVEDECLLEDMLLDDQEKNGTELLLNTNKIKKENQMISEEKLEPLSKVGGFLASAVYTSDGQLIVSKSNAKGMDIDKISALAVELFKATKGITEGMQLGTPDTITVKTENTIFIHNCIITGVSGIGAVLTLDGNVGLAHLTLKQLVKEFKPDFS